MIGWWTKLTPVPRFFVFIAAAWFLFVVIVKTGQWTGVLSNAPATATVFSPVFDNAACLRDEGHKIIEQKPDDEFRLTEDEMETVASICASAQRDYNDRVKAGG